MCVARNRGNIYHFENLNQLSPLIRNNWWQFGSDKYLLASCFMLGRVSVMSGLIESIWCFHWCWQKAMWKRMYLWCEVESCNCFWIWYESQARPTIHHRSNVIGAQLMGQMTEDAKDGEASKQRCECVQRCNNHSIAIDVMLELIKRRIHHDVAEANSQWEKALRYSCIPYLSTEKVKKQNEKFTNKFRWSFAKFSLHWAQEFYPIAVW